MKKVIMALLVVVFCMSLFAIENEKIVSTNVLLGLGTEGSPYLIDDYADLVILSTTSSYWGTGKYFKQTADIDATDSATLNSGHGLSTIGNSTSFKGIYDGQNYVISNLYISINSGRQGLFGKCEGATIKGITLANCNISGSFYTGSVIGEVIGGTTIENCIASGQVNGTSYVGGLVGHMEGSSEIDHCFASCVINGTSFVGGLLGSLQESSTVTNSFATGKVTATNLYAGGLIGYAYHASSVTNCFAEGDVLSTQYAGGLIGYGAGFSAIQKCEVKNCYALGDVKTATNAAGFIGSVSSVDVDNCYSVGSVTATSGTFFGGFISNDTSSSCTDSYWNSTTAGVATSALGTEKTTPELQTLATFTDDGWDFVDETVNGEADYWSMNSSTNDGYPYLTYAANYFQFVPTCPHVTGMYPENESNDSTLDQSIAWNAIPEIPDYTRGYEVTVDIYFNDEFVNQVVADGDELSLEGSGAILNDYVSFTISDPLSYATKYSWSVKPYYLYNGTVKIYPSTESEVYYFYTKAGVNPETINNDNPVEKVQVNIPDGATPKVPVILATLPTSGYAYQPLYAITYNCDAPGFYTIFIDAPFDEFATYHAFVDGRELEYGVEWVIDESGFTMAYIYDGAKGDVDFVITNDEDATLPVELSSFDAVMTSAKFAQINWQTASESNLLGYNIFRSESTNEDEALRVTPTMIQATNSAMGESYSFVDAEVEMNTTYNYWLQANDFNGTTESFGPVSVKISDNQDNDIQDIILGTQLFGNYPNPFNPSTNISFSVAEPQVVTIEIYNMRGQLVKTLFNDRVETPNMKVSVVWNGHDENNNKVSSGIYLYKLVTNNLIKTNKMILMK